MKTTTTKPNIYLIEFYANHPIHGTGWEINFAWVYGTSKSNAVDKLKQNQGNRFDCVITNEEQAEIFPLVGKFRVNCSNANLFIIR